MLSQHERRELQIIEQALESSDPRLSALLAGRFERRERHELMCCKFLVAFGVLVMVAAVILSLVVVFIQAMVLTSVTALWWAWLRRRAESTRRARRDGSIS
jgi:Flp pilus assembly protein TadB